MESVFYPDSLTSALRHNTENAEWARALRDQIVKAAHPWKDCPDALLWRSMFGPTLKRSWQVWSSGHCPACKGDVAMYGWEIDPFKHTWKVKCPNCAELFPKNDFKAFYESGLDAHGVFERASASRALLVDDGKPEDQQDNRPDGFGIDDGDGYSDGENTWMFIATYLIYGQWKQFVYAGISNLADAYTVTGDTAYARKAGILLDRVADLYPQFDFAEQGWLYEKKPDLGYVTNWHDACKEVHKMAHAYDQVRPALLEDASLLEFVQAQSERYQLPFQKSSMDDVAEHIENRIFRDTIENVHKIKSNFPGQEVALITMEAVLERALDTPKITEMMDDMIAQAVAVDGVTGEKGLENYSAGTLHFFADFLSTLDRMSPGFLAEQLKRHPDLAHTFRFHIDTWCLERYYPSVGDSGTFASEAPDYRGLPFPREASLQASSFSLAWKLYELTGDANYARILYRANERSVDGLPFEISESDPAAFQTAVQDAIDTHGEGLETDSINFEEWHLAILRGGQGKNQHAFWMSYDTGRRHGHANGLNIGLFARGLDLLPDFGYLPVHRGGWQGPHVDWYKGTASHNTVLVDGNNQQMDVEGETRIWQTDKGIQAIRVSAPTMYGTPYERTCVMVEVDDEHFYILDVFEVEGGQDHTYFLRGPDSTLLTDGLELAEADPFGHGTKMQNLLCQESVGPGWSTTWRHQEAAVSVRYTGLSDGMSVATAESWVSKGKWTYDDLWIPTLMVRNQGPEGLKTRFVGIIEVFNESPIVRSAQTTEAGDVGITLSNGTRDTVRLSENASISVERENT